MGRTLLLVRKLLSLSLALIAALPAIAATAAPAEGARLDPSFGTGGRLTLPRTLGELGSTVPLPDGRLLLDLREQLLCLLPSGQIDTGFGEAGYLSMQPPAGRTGGYGSFTVDQLGRLILVGSSSLPPSDGVAPTPLEDRPADAFVQRFTPNGQLDPSFGGGDGTVLTDFGLEPAEPGLSPQVGASSAVIDERGRIVLTGYRAEGIRVSKQGYKRRGSEAFLARLGGDGEVDRSFAGAGVLPLPGSDLVGAVVADRDGGSFAIAWDESRGTLVRLDADGRFDPTFGDNGGRTVPRISGRNSAAMGPLGLDPSGQLLLTAKLQGWREKARANGIGIKRFLGDGSLDRDFARRGLLSFRFPRMVVAGVSADREGGFLVAMSLREKGNREQAAPPLELALARLGADGELDPGFGRAGILPIPLRGKADIYLGSFAPTADGKALLEVIRCAKGCRTILVRIDLRA